MKINVANNRIMVVFSGLGITKIANLGLFTKQLEIVLFRYYNSNGFFSKSSKLVSSFFRPMLRVLFMFFIWLLVGLHCIVFFTLLIIPAWLVTVLFDKNLKVLHRLSSWWALTYIYGNPFWRVTITGQENIKKGQVYVIVGNHQSALDIPLLYRLPIQFRWVAKAELYRVPFVGWNLVLNRHVLVARGNATSARHMVDKCIDSLTNGVSVAIFPEGTRSRTGRISRFKEGAFVIARDANVPILPVMIDGTADAMPRDGFTVKARQHFTIRILPPVAQETLAHKTHGEIAAMFQQEFTTLHAEMRPDLYSR